MSEHLIGALSVLIAIVTIAHWFLFAILRLTEKLYINKGNKVLQKLVLYFCECLFVISMLYCFYLLIYYVVHLVDLV